MNTLLPLNPLDLTSMHWFDLGEVESPDGRSHPLNAFTPISFAPSAPPDSLDEKPKTPDYQIPIVTPMGTYNISSGVADKVSGLIPSLPSHFGARLAVAVLAIGILLIVAFRLAK